MFDLKESNAVCLQGKLPLNNILEVKSAEVGDSLDTFMDFELHNCPSPMKTPKENRQRFVKSYPEVGITEEKCEPDITDITLVTNKTKFGSGKRARNGMGCPSNRTRDVGDWRNLLDELRFKSQGEKRAAFRYMGTDNFEMNVQCLNDKYSPKLPFRLNKMFRGNLYSTGNGIDIGDYLMKNKKGVIINVMKNVLENMPNFGDNIVNPTNESAAKDNGTSPIDSLSVMKKVRDMLDVDLKNAEEIFVISEDEKKITAQKNTSKEEKSQNQNAQTVESTETLKILPDAFGDVPSGETCPATETLFDGTAICDFDPSKTKSIVIYDECADKYYIHLSELESAMQYQNRELKSMFAYDGKDFDVDKNCFGNTNDDSEELKEDFPSCSETNIEKSVKEESYAPKKDDSVIFFDEEAKKWKTDFDTIENKSRNMKEKRIETEKTKITVKSDENDSTRETVSEKAFAVKAQTEEKDPAGREKTTGFASRALEQNHKNFDARERKEENADLNVNALTEIKKPDSIVEKEDNGKKESENDCGALKTSTEEEIGTDSERDLKKPHYLSENITRISQSVAGEKETKARTNKYETVKLNISPTKRPPSKVTEINLNKIADDRSDISRVKKSESGNVEENVQKKAERQKTNRSFYKQFERYKSPFGDPEYEEGPLKINSDLESNPNLKKLEAWNKTLVLQDVSKLPENSEYWLKDDANKMATLLLRVLQEAAEENNKRSCSSGCLSSGNFYQAMRNKKEGSAVQTKGAAAAAGRKKDPSRKKHGTEGRTSVQSMKYAMTPQIMEGVKMIRGGNRTRDRGKEADKIIFRKKSFPIVEDEMQVELVSSGSFLREKTIARDRKYVKADEAEDIPGPLLLKKVASVWRRLPDLGCQMTIFSMIWMFHKVKVGSSMLTLNANGTENDPFSGLFAKHGPVVKLHSPLSGDIVLINRPQDIASVFTTEQIPGRSIFDSAEKCRIRLRQKKFSMGAEDLCGGIEWDSLRKSTTDVSDEGCAPHFGRLSHAANLLNDRIHKVRNNRNQVPEDFITEIKRWSLEGMCTVLFGRPLEFLARNRPSQVISESEQLFRQLSEATEHLCKCESHFQSWRFFNTPAMVGLSNCYQSLDLIISKYIYQADINLRKKRKYMMIKRKFDSNLTFIESMLINDRMTSEEIVSNLIDILIVGFNTTSVALGFLLYHLSQSNRIQNQLFKEVKEQLPEKTSTLKYHQMHTLKYLQACLKETFRLNMPIPFQLKVLRNDTALSHYRIPCGTHVIMDTRRACMRTQNFEEPYKFKPERWLDQAPDHPFASIPFCHGPRSGFVKRLMEVQLWTCIAKIVRNYEIEYHFEEIKNSKKVISYPDKPLKMIFNERKE